MYHDTFKILSHYRYSVIHDGETIHISKNNRNTLMAWILIVLGIISFVYSFYYLAMHDQSGFDPIFLRVLSGVGIIMPLIGLTVKSKRNKINITIDKGNHKVEITKSDAKGEHNFCLEKLQNSEYFDKHISEYYACVQIVFNDNKTNIIELKRTKPTKELEIVDKLVANLNSIIS